MALYLSHSVVLISYYIVIFNIFNYGIITISIASLRMHRNRSPCPYSDSDSSFLVSFSSFFFSAAAAATPADIDYSLTRPASTLNFIICLVLVLINIDLPKDFWNDHLEFHLSTTPDHHVVGLSGVPTLRKKPFIAR